MPKKFKVLLLSKHNVYEIFTFRKDSFTLLICDEFSPCQTAAAYGPCTLLYKQSFTRRREFRAWNPIARPPSSSYPVNITQMTHRKGQWTLMTVVSCSWFFADLHALGLCWAVYRFRTHQSHDVENNETVVHHRRGPSGDAREKKWVEVWNVIHLHP